MTVVSIQGRTYDVDDTGFLKSSRGWDERFPEAIAPQLDIHSALTEAHWKVIRFIRDSHQATNRCPLVYQTCKENGLSLADLKALFPTGYLRGACKAAGLTYREADLSTTLSHEGDSNPAPGNRTYRIDALGFLLDPADWDEAFALRLASDLKMKEGLHEAHWRVVRFLRERHENTGAVPTVYEACETLGLSLSDLEGLFPDGYHRGAVRIAGLRAR
jgi:tRNA 2-thiouridine synthesizing protein E